MTKSKGMNVAIVGVGGIGSWLTHGLARALNAQAPGSLLRLIDGDVFEPKNAERQSFTMEGPKAHIVRAEVAPIVPHIFVMSRNAWIVPDDQAEDESDDNVVGKISATSIMSEDSHIFVAVDNFAARKLIFDAAKTFKNIDIYTGGNGSPDTGDGLFGSIYHYQRRDGVDITAPPGLYHPEFVNPDDRNPGELSCQERAELDGGTQLLAINLTVAAMLLAKASQIMFGSDEEKKEALTRAEIVIDLSEGLAQSYDRQPVPEPATVSAVS